MKAIGYGSNRQISRAIDVFTAEEVVVKLERSNVLQPQLANERRVYDVLQGGEGVPRAHWFGKEDLAGKEYTIMVMDHLGPSLNDLFLFCSNKFTLKTVLMLSNQMIDRIEFLHRKDFIHRDIKPKNFLMGVFDQRDIVSLVDLGLAKKYKEVVGSIISDKRIVDT